MMIAITMVKANPFARNYYREEKIDNGNAGFNVIDQTKGGDPRNAMINVRNWDEQELIFPEMLDLDRRNPNSDYKNAGIKTRRVPRAYGSEIQRDIKTGYGQGHGSDHIHLDYDRHDSNALRHDQYSHGFNSYDSGRLGSHHDRQIGHHGSSLGYGGVGEHRPIGGHNGIGHLDEHRPIGHGIGGQGLHYDEHRPIGHGEIGGHHSLHSSAHSGGYGSGYPSIESSGTKYGRKY